jgi:AbrB family looped-hinge helix DNA binding protein
VKARAVRMDSKGRITIPIATRKRLGIEEGDTLFVQISEDRIDIFVSDPTKEAEHAPRKGS